jgi:Tfp pilus assembly protein PilP
MKVWIILYFIFFIPKAHSQEQSENTSAASFHLFKSKTFVKNPLDLRDPFKRKITKRKSQVMKIHDSGIYSNQNDIIENKPIESIRIVGVMIGKERRAMAKIASGKTLLPEVFYIKEGMKLGASGAEVKAILPGGIVLVEKIRNVYDQDEYLETVIPISNE